MMTVYEISLVVALQAAIAVEAHALSGRRRSMWIVTCCTRYLVSGSPHARAFKQSLPLAGRASTRPYFAGTNKISDAIEKIIAGPEVCQFISLVDDCRLALEVTA